MSSFKFVLLLNLLVSASPRAQTASKLNPCGLSGGLDDRIKECALTDKNNWKLVSRSISQSADLGLIKKEIWQDPVTNYLWGAVLEPQMISDALTACKPNLEENGFGSDEAIVGYHFDLPTTQQYLLAAKHGFLESPGVPGEFWTSQLFSRARKRKKEVSIYYSFTQTESGHFYFLPKLGDPNLTLAFRCVGIPD